MARSIFGRQSTTSNTMPSGVPQGTLGGRRTSMGGRPGMKLNIGDEGYLWLLVLIEVFLLGWLRQRFRRRHGG